MKLTSDDVVKLVKNKAEISNDEPTAADYDRWRKNEDLRQRVITDKLLHERITTMIKQVEHSVKQKKEIITELTNEQIEGQVVHNATADLVVEFRKAFPSGQPLPDKDELQDRLSVLLGYDSEQQQEKIQAEAEEYRQKDEKITRSIQEDTKE